MQGQKRSLSAGQSLPPHHLPGSGLAGGQAGLHCGKTGSFSTPSTARVPGTVKSGAGTCAATVGWSWEKESPCQVGLPDVPARVLLGVRLGPHMAGGSFPSAAAPWQREFPELLFAVLGILVGECKRSAPCGVGTSSLVAWIMWGWDWFLMR